MFSSNSQSPQVTQSASHSRRYQQPLDNFYLPFLKHPQIVHMGLHKLDPVQWIQPCAQLPHYLQNKLNQRRNLGDRVYAQLLHSLPAQLELHRLLQQHLCRDHKNAYFRSSDRINWRNEVDELRWSSDSGREPLWQASQWIADDLCILLPGKQGYALAAASLAAPSYWRLEDKIGQPLNIIHAPVPGFKRQLAEQVARFFDHLMPEFPVWRGNWSVVNSAELLQRGDVPRRSEGLFLRVERQSLRRLPQTGAVVFSIRVMINPLQDLLDVQCAGMKSASEGGAVAALQSAVAAMSTQESRYKSLAPLLPQLQAFFSAAAL